MNKTLIIAEAGVNHNGDMELAKKLIDAGADACVDYVKFQTFKAEKLVSKAAKKANYQVENTGNAADSQFEMLKKLEIDVDSHKMLIDYCNSKGVKFLSTAFDLDSIDMLDGLGIDLFKVPSGEMTNLPYLRKIATKNKPVVLSTGMCNMTDIEKAIAVFTDANYKREDLIVLHCNTEYPTPMEDVNLSAMNSIGDAFKVKVGYSDHTLGIEVPISAVAMGGCLIEKHFTLDNTMEGPDHRASLEPHELKAMVSGIRNIEKALGNGVKLPSASEAKNMAIARKSIHLADDISEGVIITENDLIMKRPGDGISPMDCDMVIGKTVNKNLTAEHKLTWTDLA